MLDETNLLTLAAMARRLRVPSPWLKAEAVAGRLPGLKTGDGWLFHVPTVVRHLEDRAARGEMANSATRTEVGRA
jgi:hypothetical protein